MVDETNEGLKKMGLDLEDFGKELIPLIDVYGWLLRGGHYKKETEKMLEEVYKRCEDIALELRAELEKSFG